MIDKKKFGTNLYKDLVGTHFWILTKKKKEFYSNDKSFVLAQTFHNLFK